MTPLRLRLIEIDLLELVIDALNVAHFYCFEAFIGSEILPRNKFEL